LRPGKDKRISTLIGNHQPIIVPVLNVLVGVTVDAVTNLTGPKTCEAGKEIGVAVTPYCDVDRTKLSEILCDCVRKLELPLPIGGRLWTENSRRINSSDNLLGCVVRGHAYNAFNRYQTK